MLSLNFSSRAQLREIGLSDADVDAFIELRTRIGEVLPNALNTGGVSANGRAVLERAMDEDDETDRLMSRLQLTLRPAPPLATMEPMTIALTHHGNIDRELRVFEAPFLPHGPMQLDVFDISHEHIVKIEVRTPSGELVSDRAAIPLADVESNVGEGSSGWRHLPPLRSGE